MTRPEWVRRCAERLVKCGGIDHPWAMLMAAGLADEQAELHGTGIAWALPEDAADEDLAAFDAELAEQL